MKIRDFKYTPEDVDCRYCTKFIRGHCRANGCPWINERIEAGVIGYTEALERRIKYGFTKYRFILFRRSPICTRQS